MRDERVIVHENPWSLNRPGIEARGVVCSGVEIQHLTPASIIAEM
jgi:hypothetical protein